MEAKMKYWTSVIKNILIFCLTLFLLYALFKVAIFYIPFLIGFIISLIIEPLIKKISNKIGLTRKASAIIILSIIFSILVGLIIWGIITLIAESSNLLESLNIYIEKTYNLVQKYILNIKIKEVNLPSNVMAIISNLTTQILGSATKFITNFLTSSLQKVRAIPVAFIYIAITILSTYFICADKFFILDQLEHHVPRLWVKRFGKHVREISKTLGNYLKEEAILILISFVIILFGLIVGKIVGLNIEYPLLSALGIAFVDALPILGAGTVIIPWAIISFLDRNVSLSLVLIGLYIITFVIRQILEPKLVSRGIGTHPVFTLISMYTGFKIIGIGGLFLGPIILIILKNIFPQMIDNGIVKTIFNRG